MPQSPHRLDALMNARRVDLGLSWREVAAAAGIATETLRAVRKGVNPPGDLTKRGIETALRWQSGSIDAIMDEGEPTPLEHAARAVRESPELTQVEAYAALLATLSPEEQDEVMRLHRLRQQQRHPNPERNTG